MTTLTSDSSEIEKLKTALLQSNTREKDFQTKMGVLLIENDKLNKALIASVSGTEKLSTENKSLRD